VLRVSIVSGLGEEAFIGTSAQGDETHLGGGALYDDLIVIDQGDVLLKDFLHLGVERREV
jgi:hypothetical protein